MKLLFVSICFVVTLNTLQITAKRPVIIFPGLFSNSIWQAPDATRNCFSQNRLWYSASASFFTNPCWADAMKLRYIASTNHVEDNARMMWPPDFGSINSIEDIGEKKYFTATRLYKEMIDRLVGAGLKRDDTIRAVPCDWRKAVTDLDSSYYELVLTELKTTKHRTGKKATIICHSNGCINFTNFILRSDPKVINEYIHRIITLGAPWKGSTKALDGLLNGDNLSLPFHYASRLKQITRTFTSLVYLLPDKDVLDHFNPFITINGKAYKDIPNLLTKFGFHANITIGRNNITGVIDAFKLLDSSIKIYCLFGNTSKNVLSKLEYVGEWNSNGQLENYRVKDQNQGEGDGTVPLLSLQACEDVSKTYITKVEKFDVDHQGMLSDERVLNFILRNIH